jgi:hypothetical protein
MNVAFIDTLFKQNIQGDLRVVDITVDDLLRLYNQKVSCTQYLW